MLPRPPFVRRTVIAAVPLIILLCSSVFAGSGQEGASFLDIPVGAGPAAMGGAYSALANDAYAPVWNPAGLGQLASTELSGQHLAYLDSLHYEFFSIVHPLHVGSGFGASVQYLGTGKMTELDENGSEQGSFSSYYAAYNLSYGFAVNDRLSLGATGKLIQAQLADVSAHAFAGDLGVMYRADSRLTLAGTVSNLGSSLRFIDQKDPLPMVARAGFAYQATPHWLLSAEGAYRRNGPTSGHVGVEWHPLSVLSLRAGYRTDVLKELSPMAGLTTGISINAWGQELAYAWSPMGDLGTTHNISFIARFGNTAARKRHLIEYRSLKNPMVKNAEGKDIPVAQNIEYQQLMEIMNEQANPSAHYVQDNDDRYR